MLLKKKIIAACASGTFLEFYDFVLYGFMASHLGKIFFPSENDFVSLLFSYGAFAVSFVARPFGAYVFGKKGDKDGGGKAICFSIFVMSISTFLIGCLPSYQDIGVVAPLSLVMLRFIQGISTGGEYNGAFIYAFDKNKDKQGFIGGIITASAVLGMICASIMAWTVEIVGVDPFWRIPFIMGGILGFLGYLLRKKLELNQESQDKPDEIKDFQIKKAAIIIMIGGISGALFYTQFIFFKGYVSSIYPVRPDFLSGIITAFMIFYMVLLIIIGKVSDKYGYLFIIRISCASILIFSPLLFYFLSLNNYVYAFLFQMFFCFATSSFVAPSHAFMKKIAPKKIQYAFISFNFSLGMSVVGGTSPLIAHVLTNWAKTPVAVGVFISFLSIIFLVLTRKLRNQKVFVE